MLHLRAGDVLEGTDRKPVDHKNGGFPPPEIKMKKERLHTACNVSEQENLTRLHL